MSDHWRLLVSLHSAQAQHAGPTQPTASLQAQAGSVSSAHRLLVGDFVEEVGVDDARILAHLAGWEEAKAASWGLPSRQRMPPPSPSDGAGCGVRRAAQTAGPPCTCKGDGSLARCMNCCWTAAWLALLGTAGHNRALLGTAGRSWALLRAPGRAACGCSSRCVA